jgi:hypothetical protein
MQPVKLGEMARLAGVRGEAQLFLDRRERGGDVGR